jgi:hypothetical protein
MVTDAHHKEPMILKQGSCPKHEKPVCLKSFSCGGAERTEDSQRLLLFDYPLDTARNHMSFFKISGNGKPGHKKESYCMDQVDNEIQFCQQSDVYYHQTVGAIAQGA